ncbi:hypothetical protein [Cellulosimicrobium marinum]|uniref:hypothetical protein n=1 Tax=Cellulosimicrobium marinum TaxID=1638992 RepID=UPI001E4F92E8|nr:hypothetical protein [Cellulosimicrobium marinum]MCB7135733.1 hypothetical protein [Cellulosimicrobium marinum]
MREQTTMRWSADDIAAAEATLARVVPGEATSVGVLTDEEVVVLDGLQHEQLVPTPWLDAQEGADRTLVGRVALRSLLARGLVVPGGGDGTDAGGGEDVSIEAVPEITGPLVLRRTAGAILSAERVTSGGRHWVFAYVHEDGCVLEEEVSRSGHHSFVVYPLDHLGERLVPFLDPQRSAVLDGRERRLDAAELRAGAPTTPGLATAVAATTLSAVRAGSDELVNVTVYAGPDGVFALRGAERDASGAPAAYTLAELGPATLAALPGSLVGA